jgi:signal transduction histidine kinase
MKIWSWLVSVRRVGLRVEILLNLTILLGAVLFFSGFLWIRFVEDTLVSQRVSLAREMVDLVVGRKVSVSPSGPSGEEMALSGIRETLRSIDNNDLVSAWALYDHNLHRVADYRGAAMEPVGVPQLRKGLLDRDIQVDLDYPPFSGWFGSGHGPEEIRPLRVIASIPSSSPLPGGVLAIDFPLKDIPARIRAEILGYLKFAVPAVLIVIGFGLFLLVKNVVQPLEILDGSTRRVAGGDLECRVQAAGPREFVSLAGSFNAMTASLREKRAETDRYIRDLEATNRDLRETREELIQAAKMASIGHLAAGMAHELGTPLGAVQGYLELLRDEEDDTARKSITEHSLGEIERINRLVRDLLDYAAPARRDAVVDCFDPVTTLREAAGVFLHRDGRIVVDDRLPESLPEVAMPRHQLVQVFVNLLMNARDASAAAPRNPIVLEGGEDGETVWLAVSDGGEGIPEENLPCLFEPFFTTKAPGQGRGLGLAICRRIVVDAGGKIEVRSKPQQGTTFRVVLKKAARRGDAV